MRPKSWWDGLALRPLVFADDYIPWLERGHVDRHPLRETNHGDRVYQAHCDTNVGAPSTGHRPRPAVRGAAPLLLLRGAVRRGQSGRDSRQEQLHRPQRGSGSRVALGMPRVHSGSAGRRRDHHDRRRRAARATGLHAGLLVAGDGRHGGRGQQGPRRSAEAGLPVAAAAAVGPGALRLGPEAPALPRHCQPQWVAPVRRHTGDGADRVPVPRSVDAP